jgi:uncharacterized protein with beta-barrel porin domain
MARSHHLAAAATAAGLALAGPGLVPAARADCQTAGAVTTCSGESGGGAFGVQQIGDARTVINLGTLTGTTAGVSLAGDGDVVINTGTIAGGSGVQTAGSNNTVTNGGTIAGAIDGINLGGISPFGNTVINNGLVTGGQGAGIAMIGAGLIVNNGVVRNVATDAGGALVGFALNVATGAVTVNNGTFDGVIFSGGSLVNAGLITVSVPGTGATHTITTFQQAASGVLRLRGDAAGNRDRLVIEQPSTLGGALQVALQPGLYGNTTVYASMVRGGGGFGGTQFAAATASSPYFTVSVTYGAITPTDVDVTLTRIPFNQVPGLTVNQRAIATALEQAYNPGLTGPAATLYTNLFAAPGLPVLDSLSGEIASAVQNPSFALGMQVLDMMSGRQQRRRDMPCTGSSGGGSGRWSAWAAGLGLGGHRDGDAGIGSARLGSSSAGGAAGADMCIGSNFVLGITVGAATTDFSLDGRAASGTARTGFVGTYGSWSFGPVYVDIGLAYLRNEYSTTRTATVNTLNEIATGDFAGNQVASRMEAGWRFHVRGFQLVPFVGLSGQVLRQNSYGETAVSTATGQPGVLGLNMQGATTNAPLPVLGGEASTTWEIGELLTITPRLRLSWGRETSTDRKASGSFQSLPGANFTVNGAPAARSAINVRAGVDIDVLRFFEAYAQFDGALAAGGSGFAGTAGVRMTW